MPRDSATDGNTLNGYPKNTDAVPGFCELPPTRSCYVCDYFAIMPTKHKVKCTRYDVDFGWTSGAARAMLYVCDDYARATLLPLRI